MPDTTTPAPDTQAEPSPIPAIPTHGGEVILKGIIAVTIVVCGGIVSDHYYEKVLSELTLHNLGLLIMGLVALRAYTDGSYTNYKRQAASTPQTATEPPQTATAPIEIATTDTSATGTTNATNTANTTTEETL